MFFQSEEQGDFYKKCEELKDFDLVIVVGGDGIEDPAHHLHLLARIHVAKAEGGTITRRMRAVGGGVGHSRRLARRSAPVIR